MKTHQYTRNVLASLAAVTLAVSALVGCGSSGTSTKSASSAASSGGLPAVTGGEFGSTPTLAAGTGDAPKELQKAVLKEGSGEKCGEDAIINIAYLGQLWNGTKFDSSYDDKKSVIFNLDSLIKGWQEGLADAQPGSRIELVVPPDQGYGSTATGSIPANSTLVFVIDVFDCVAAGSVDTSVLKKATVTGNTFPGVEVSGELGEKPTIKVTGSDFPSSSDFVTTAEGTGEAIAAGDTALVQATRVVIGSEQTQSSWDQGGVQTISTTQLPNLENVKVGSRMAGVVVGSDGSKSAVVVDVVSKLSPVETH